MRIFLTLRRVRHREGDESGVSKMIDNFPWDPEWDQKMHTVCLCYYSMGFYTSTFVHATSCMFRGYCDLVLRLQ